MLIEDQFGKILVVVTTGTFQLKHVYKKAEYVELTLMTLRWAPYHLVYGYKFQGNPRQLTEVT